MRLLLRELVILLAIGLAIGEAATIALGKSMNALLFGLTPHDPMILSVSAALLTIVALFAGYLGTRRITRLDPLEALRHKAPSAPGTPERQRQGRRSLGPRVRQLRSRSVQNASV